MTSWTRLTLPLGLALLGAACTPPPAEVSTTSSESDASGSTTSGPTPTTMPGSTTPGEDTMGTMGGTGMDTTMGVLDTTASTSTSDGDTTTTVDPTTSSSSDGGESSSSGEPPPECRAPTDCPNNETCSAMGECVDACGGAWGSGNYGECFNEYGAYDEAGLCDGGICIGAGMPLSSTTCSVQGCSDACDCPAPAPTGNATVTCGQITNPANGSDCYLSCQDGETCPDGMSCFGGFLCTTPLPAEVPTYGNCGLATCAGAGYCFDGNNDENVCHESCGDALDCPPAPPGGTAVVACDTVNGDVSGPECYLDCSGGLTCPVGMFCYQGYMCVFP